MDAKTEQIIDLAIQNGEAAHIKRSGKSDLDHEKKVKLIWLNIAKVFLLVLTLLAFTRVPFVGTFFDSLVDYLFGIGKYFFYALIIFVLIGWIFNPSYNRIVRTKRFLIFSILVQISVCCIISGVMALVYSNDPANFVTGMKSYHESWLEYFKTWQYSGFFHDSWKTGGIIAEMIAYIFSYLSMVVLVVVSAVIIFISVFVILNANYRSTRVGLRIRGWMVRKLGGTFKYDGYNELKAKKDNQNKFKHRKREEIEVTALSNSSIPFELLPDTELNKSSANFKHARHLQNKLTTLFRNNKIDCIPTDVNVYTSYCDICFEAKDKSQVKEMLKLQPKIAKVTKLDHFNISLRGNIVNIEIENVFFSKICLKTAFEMYDIGKDVTAVFGVDKQNDLCMQDFRNSPSALIVGKKGSGAATLAVLMALSTCYITTPDNLELVVLNPNCEATYSYFVNLPHANNKVYETITACTDKLHELQELVNERNSLLKVNNVNNIDQYNKATVSAINKFKHVLVVITNLDSMVKDTFQNNKIISDLLVNGPKTGVYVVLQSYVANNDVLDKAIIDNVTNKYILALSSQEESLKIFENKRGYQLHGNGDCLSFAKDKITKMRRMQICNINFAELTTDVDLIKTFYSAKQKQREEQILSEAEKNGQ